MFSTNLNTKALFVGATLLLLMLVVLAYKDAPQNGFHLDDSQNIFRYPPVMVTDLTVSNVVDAGRNALLPRRPLPSMTFAIDWARGGGTARAFQQTNVAIHALTAFAVFGLLLLVLRRLEFSPNICLVSSFFGAALWASHPIHVQAVTYTVQRMASMAALFTILALVLYILGRHSSTVWRRWLLYGAGVACWIFGMASKETAAIAPFLVLLIEYGVLRHGENLVRNRLDVGLLALPAILALFVVMDISSGKGPLSQALLGGYEFRDFTLSERLMTQPRVVAMHLSQVFWPLPSRFSLEHDIVTSTGLLTPPATLSALIGLIAWCGAGLQLLFRPRWRVVGALLLWVPATLVIESSFIPLEMVFEHRMYLPTVALGGLVALAIAWLLDNRPRWTIPAVGVCALLVALLILSTSRYVPVWKDTLSLSRHSVEVAPNSARAWASVASTLHKQGYGWSTVVPPMQRALELNPNQGVALNLKALRLIELGQFDQADQIISKLLPRAAVDHSVVNTSGMLRLAQGDLEAAANDFERVTELNPYEPVFHYNLALSYELSGRCKDALSAWSKFLNMETDRQRIALVRERLRTSFLTAGGRCYPSD